MISDGVSIISNSWAYCEDQTSKADVDGIDSLFKDSGAAGNQRFQRIGRHGQHLPRRRCEYHRCAR